MPSTFATTDQLARITEPQRECLRLVLDHHSSKMIAIRLGISKTAVDQRIDRAVKILGATSRIDAAMMLKAAESDGPDSSTYDRVTRDPIDLDQTTDNRASNSSASELNDGGAVPLEWEPPSSPSVGERRSGIWIDLNWATGGGKIRAALAAMLTLLVATALMAVLYEVVQHGLLERAGLLESTNR